MNNIPTVTRNLLIVNVLCFFAAEVLKRYGIDLDGILGLHFFMASDFRLYQFVSYMFMHGGFTHLFFNMFAVWMFGQVMERTWGPQRFLLFYFVCGIGAGLTQEMVQLARYYIEGLSAYQTVNLNGMSIIPMDQYLNLWTTIGASGAVYGILLAFGMTYPDEPLYLMFVPIPIKAKYFVIGYAAIELFSAFSAVSDGVAHFAHLGGMLFGWLLIHYWRHHGRGGREWHEYRSWTDRIKDLLRSLSTRSNQQKPRMKVHFSSSKATTPHSDDYAYNAQQKAHQEEIDRILDKIKRSGYNTLTESEKKTLFDASKK